MPGQDTQLPAIDWHRVSGAVCAHARMGARAALARLRPEIGAGLRAVVPTPDGQHRIAFTETGAALVAEDWPNAFWRADPGYAADTFALFYRYAPDARRIAAPQESVLRFTGRLEPRDHARILTALIGDPRGCIPLQAGLPNLLDPQGQPWQRRDPETISPWHDLVAFSPADGEGDGLVPHDLEELLAPCRRIVAEGWDEAAARATIRRFFG